MIEYAYYNGVLTPYDAACIPLSDRSIFFGDAVYDVVVGRGKKTYQLDLHLDRLLHNAERIGLKNPPTRYELKAAAEMLLSEADADSFLLYIQLSASGMRRGHARVSEDVNTLITVTGCPLPTELGRIKAITLPDVRHGYCDVKTVNLLPAILSVEEADRRGSDIAIFHKVDTVTECSYANVSLLAGGVLITHPHDKDVLPGITEDNLLLAAERLGIPTICRPFTVDELRKADAVLISSTTKLIKICTEIDGIPLRVTAYPTAERLFNELLHDMCCEIG